MASHTQILRFHCAGGLPYVLPYHLRKVNEARVDFFQKRQQQQLDKTMLRVDGWFNIFAVSGSVWLPSNIDHPKNSVHISSRPGHRDL